MIRFCESCGKVLEKKKYKCSSNEKGWKWECSINFDKRQFCDKSCANKGKNNPMYDVHKKGKDSHMWGKKLSEEHKRKISEGNKGKIISEKTRKKLSEVMKGEKAPNWQGGRRRINGCIYIYKPSHPYAHKRGYVAEHRLMMEKKIGRLLKPNEIVHHKNEIKIDNCPENLYLCKNHSEHTKLHWDLRREV